MASDQDLPASQDDGGGEKKKPTCEIQRCPFCPVTTTSLNRHLRLVHSVTNSKKPSKISVHKKMACKLCQREVSQFPSHIKTYHRISRQSSLYKHILQLSRYGFSQCEDNVASSDSATERESDNEAMLRDFVKHLVSVDGGFRSEDSAENQRRQLSHILTNSGIQILQDLSPLMQERGYLYRQWKSSDAGKRPWRVGTLKSYMYSLKLFLDYCKYVGKYVSAEKCEQGLTKVSRWISSLKEETKKRRVELHEEEDEMLLSPEDIKRFYTSASHQKVVGLLQSIQKAKTASMIDQSSVSAIRNDIILWILLENGQRSGSVVNATLAEFDGAKMIDDQWVIRVKNHKTYSTYGCCNIVLSKEIHQHLCTWTTLIRPMLSDKVPEQDRDDADNTRLFINFNGKSLKEHNHATQLTKHTEQALGVSNVTATRIRKSLVVMLQETGTSEHQMCEVANHFTHSRNTQQRHYNVRKSIQTSLRATSAIKSLSKPSTSKDPSSLPTRIDSSQELGTGVWTLQSKESMSHASQATTSKDLASPSQTVRGEPLTDLLQEADTGVWTLECEESLSHASQATTSKDLTSPSRTVRSEPLTDLLQEAHTGVWTLECEESLSNESQATTSKDLTSPSQTVRSEPLTGLLQEADPGVWTLGCEESLSHATKATTSKDITSPSQTVRGKPSTNLLQEAHTGVSTLECEESLSHASQATTSKDLTSPSQTVRSEPLTDFPQGADSGVWTLECKEYLSHASQATTSTILKDLPSPSQTIGSEPSTDLLQEAGTGVGPLQSKESLTVQDSEQQTASTDVLSLGNRPTVRNLWNPTQAKRLISALRPYLNNCLKAGYLPKLPDVYAALVDHNLLYIMEQNGRQRTMEKVRLEFKKMKKRDSLKDS